VAVPAATTTTLNPLVPLAVSLVSIGLSIATLWLSRLAPPKLQARMATRVELTANPLSPADPALIVRVVIHNSGAQPAFVSEIAAGLRRAGAHRQTVLFQSLVEKHDEEIGFGKEPASPRLSPFATFAVGAGQTVVKSVLLRIRTPGELSAFPLGPHELSCHLLVDGTGGGWIDAPRVEIDIEQADLDALKTITVTPLPDGRSFVKWFTQSKPVMGVGRELEKLARERAR
jgi:hypothetical protein